MTSMASAGFGLLDAMDYTSGGKEEYQHDEQGITVEASSIWLLP